MPPRFRETWVPFCLDDLDPAESIPLRDPVLSVSGRDDHEAWSRR